MSDYDDLFSEDMSYPEAQRIFFSAVEGKTKEEIEQIKKAYSKVVPVITKREMTENPYRLG